MLVCQTNRQTKKLQQQNIKHLQLQLEKNKKKNLKFFKL